MEPVPAEVTEERSHHLVPGEELLAPHLQDGGPQEGQPGAHGPSETPQLQTQMAGT